MLRLTWGAGGTSSSRKAWGRNSRAPRVSHLPLQPGYAHWTRWAHVVQTLARETALVLRLLPVCPCCGSWKRTASRRGDRDPAGCAETDHLLQGGPKAENAPWVGRYVPSYAPPQRRSAAGQPWAYFMVISPVKTKPKKQQRINVPTSTPE